MSDQDLVHNLSHALAAWKHTNKDYFFITAVNPLTEHKISVVCKESDTVLDLKRRIQSEESMHIDHLIFDKRPLKKEDRKVMNCYIQKGDTVYLVVKPPRMGEKMERSKRKSAAMRRESHGILDENNNIKAVEAK